MDGLGLVNLMMNVVHLHLNVLQLVRLVILALDPLILKLSVISARRGWHVGQELARAIAPDIMSIAHDGASLNGVASQRSIVFQKLAFVTAPVVMVPWGIHRLLGSLNGRVSLAVCIVNKKAVVKVGILFLLLR